MSSVPPAPTDVFVPARIPLKEENAYTQRNDPERLLQRCVATHQIPVIFGAYGVGKTTVGRRFFLQEEQEGRVVYIPSADGMTLRDISMQICSELAVRAEQQSEETREILGELGFKIGRVNAGKAVRTVTQPVVSEPTTIDILKIMQAAKLVLIVDEFHRAADALRQELSGFIKSASGLSDAYPVVVLIGTAADAENLVRHDPGIDRLVMEIEVASLSDAESERIVVSGFGKLGLQIPESTIGQVVASAAGAPTLVHAVCLEMAELANARGDLFVTQADYEAAIRGYLQQHGKRLLSAYRKSIEHHGPKRYRKQILRAMSELPNDYAALEEIREKVSEYLSTPTPSSALSGPLRELKSGPAPILADVQRAPSGDFGQQRIHSLTQFKDPMMKSFIRFINEVEHQGIGLPTP